MNALTKGKTEIKRVTKGCVTGGNSLGPFAGEISRTGRIDHKQHAKWRANPDRARPVNRVHGNIIDAIGIQRFDMFGLFGQNMAHASALKGDNHMIMRANIKCLLRITAFILTGNRRRIARQLSSRQSRSNCRQCLGNSVNQAAKFISRQTASKDRSINHAVIGEFQHVRASVIEGYGHRYTRFLIFWAHAV